MRRRELAWIALVPLCLPPVESATVRPDPEYIFTQWETGDGLPESSTTSIVQSADGYLWLGTFNGLARFDGSKFTVFDTSNTPGLPHDGVVNLYIDRGGALWVSTLGGMARLKDGEWKSYRTESGWRGDYARFFAEDAAGTLFVSSFDGRIFRFQNEQFADLGPLPAERTQPEEASAFLRAGHDGRMLAASGGAVSVWADQRWEQVALPPEIETMRLRSEEAHWGAAREGGLWLLARSTLYHVARDRIGRKVALGPPIGGVWSIHESPDGAVWISSFNEGLVRVRPDGSVRRFSRATGFLSDSLRTLFTDRQGNHWAGTNGNGLIRILARRFLSYGEGEGLPAARATSLARMPDGSYLVGTYGRGVYRLRNGRGQPELPDDGFVQTIHVDRVGRLWIGRYSNGLRILDRGRELSVPDALGAGVTIEALFEDSRGRVWIGATDRAAVYENGAFAMLDVDQASGPVMALYFTEDPASRQIWAAGDGGLYRVENRKLIRVLDARGERMPALRCVRVARDGSLWLGTRARGLLHWRDGALRIIDARYGLGARNVGEILVENGSYWLAGNQGVWRAKADDLEAAAEGRRQEVEWQSFGVNDGLASLECSAWHQPSALREPGGRLWFTTLRGVSMVDSKLLAIDPAGSPVRIEEIAYREPDETPRRIPVGNAVSVTLPRGSHHVRLLYTALDLRSPEKALFEYRLRQGDHVDIGRTAERQIIFHHLETGTSQFTMRSRNGDGVWSEWSSELAVVREPEYWETLGFRAAATVLSAAVLAALVIGASRVRTRRQMAELKREREIAATKARLAAVVENTTDAVAFTALDSTILYMNRAAKRLLGLPEEFDAAGMRSPAIHPKWAWELISKDGFPRAVADGTWQGHTAVLHRDGREIPVWQVIAVHRGPGGRPEFVSSIARDITEIRATETALRLAKEGAEEAARMKSEFLATMSHEIRTPMNGILGMTELLLTGELGAEERACAETAHTSAKALLQLLNDILDLSRIEAGRLELVPVAFDLERVTRSAVDLVKPLAAQRGLELRYDGPSRGPVLHGDSIRLRQIMLNFLDNAIKFTDAGTVAVMFEEIGRGPDGVTVRVQVSDTGCGIAPEKLPTVFDMFTQADSSDTRRHGGAGLGLSICKRLAELMGGSVGVESRLGEGSTFWAEIPFAAADESGEQASVRGGSRPARGRGRVLVVEDNPINRLVARRQLEQLGCDVELADNGVEGLLLAQSSAYDLILMDIHMPKMDGFEAASRIRRGETAGNCRIVAMTASAMTGDREKCLAAGMDDFVAKPVTLERLDALLRRYLGGRASGAGEGE